MKSYHVLWEIDVDAKTARGAAEEALRIMQDPCSTATVFSVTEEDSDLTEDVDLEVAEAD